MFRRSLAVKDGPAGGRKGQTASLAFVALHAALGLPGFDNVLPSLTHLKLLIGGTHVIWTEISWFGKLLHQSLRTHDCYQPTSFRDHTQEGDYRILQNEQSPELLRDRQQLRREGKPIHFTYRLPASFADGGVSERFTIEAVRYEGEYVIVEASDTSEFHIIRTLLGYGEHALLLDGPSTLVQKMHEAVMQMGKNYGLESVHKT